MARPRLEPGALGAVRFAHRPNGRVLAQAGLRDFAGRLHHLSATGDSEQHARDLLLEQRSTFLGGSTTRLTGASTVAEAAEAWLAVVARGIEESSLRTYKNSRDFMLKYISAVALGDVTLEVVEALVAKAADDARAGGRGDGVAAAERLRSTLSMVLAFAQTQREAATAAGVSERLVRDRSLIMKDGTDQIIRDVVNGKLSVSAAASLIRAQRTERQTAAALYVSHRRSSSSDAWLTPKWLVDRAVACLGGIDGDVAAEEERGVPARWWLTAQDDALTTPSWSNPDGSPANLWMNPPHNSSGKGPGDWTRRVVAEWEAGRVRSALLLLPARPGAKWQQELARFPRVELAGHLTFEPGHGNPARDGWVRGKRAEAPFASLLIGVGVQASELHHHFGDVGVVFVSYGHSES